MIRASLFTAAAAFCLAPTAQADHDHFGGYYGPQPSVASVACEKQKDSDRLAGGLVGAVAGGLIGAAIGGELEPDNGFHRYRGHRGYRGYRGHRGYRGYRRGYYHDRGDDGAEIAGGLIGALAGAAIGSELAGGSTDCARTYSTGYPRSSGYYGSSRTYATQNYGGELTGVHAPTRSPTGPAWENPQAQQSAGPAYPQSASAPRDFPDYPSYPDADQEDLYGAPETDPKERECTNVTRETRLPDGTVIREPVEVCQTEDGRWQMPEPIPSY